MVMLPKNVDDDDVLENELTCRNSDREMDDEDYISVLFKLMLVQSSLSLSFICNLYKINSYLKWK